MKSVAPAPPRMSKPEGPAPLDVYYVVETTGDVVGERHHLVSSVLYATARQAEAELERLATADATTEYTVWKSSTYLEPAHWAYDVVLADGTVLPSNASMLEQKLTLREAEMPAPRSGGRVGSEDPPDAGGGRRSR